MMGEPENTYAVICARGGSKRLKGKNLFRLEGKPLIAYTIETALASRVFSRVVVNSEDTEILAVSEEYGAETYRRPEHLGTDTTYVIEVVREMIRSLGFHDDATAGILFPTCPLRAVEDIRGALDLFRANGGNTPVVSVTTYDYPIWVALDIDKDQRLEPVFPEDYGRSTRHNDHKKSYHANYAVIFNSVRNLKVQTNLIGERPIPYVMPPERSIDIDEPFQMKLVHALLRYEGQ